MRGQHYLINSAPDGVVEDAADQETLHIGGVNVELPGDEGDVDPGVRLDQLDQHLGPDVAKQVFDVFSDESVLHYGLTIDLQDLLEVFDVIVLVSVHEVCHGEDLHIVLVRFGLLGVEWVDTRLHQHVG